MAKKQRATNRWFLEPLGREDKEGNKKPAKFKKFCVYDIESKKGDTQEAGFERPFVCGTYDPEEREFHEFRNEPHLAKRPWRRRHIEPGGCYDKLLNYLLTPRFSGRVIYAHFGGSFDHLFTLAWLRMHQDEFGFEVIPVQSSIQVLRVWRWPEEPDGEPQEKWDFLDTHKLLPMALSKACKAFQVPNKIDMDLHRHEDSPEWSPYLERDCVALSMVAERMYTMVHDILGGEIGITTPSTSMKLFRRKFMGKHGVAEKIQRHAHFFECRKTKAAFDAPDGCPGCLHEFIRRGYYGGRTEIFRMFGTSLHYFDINSSYVAAMKEDMPVGDKWVEDVNAAGNGIDWQKVRTPEHPDRKYAGFAEVTVLIPEACPIPPLPHKDKLSGKLMFPVGQLHGVWSLDELLLLDDPLVQGQILWTGKVVYYKLEPCFGHMVTELWKLRDTKNPKYDPGLSELAKLLGNGLYGKFAMRQERTQMVFQKADRTVGSCMVCGGETGLEGVGATDSTKDPALCNGCLGSKAANPADPDCDVWYQAKKVDAPYIIPHISAYITAKARVRLWQFMRTAVRTPAGQRPASTFKDGDVAIIDGHPCIVEKNEVLDADALDIRVELVLRDLDQEMDLVRVVSPDEMFEGGGRVFYSDTDSIITDAVLPQTSCRCGHLWAAHPADQACNEPGCDCKRWQAYVWGTGSKLGEMKDEYPGELLNYLSVQPKVYVIEKRKHNAAVKAARNQLAALEAGLLSPTEAEDLRERWANAKQEAALVKFQAAAAFGIYAKHEFYSPDKLDPIALQEYSKVTMKGFPPAMRTRENLERLRGGKIDWDVIETGVMAETGKGEILEWTQLEKVRTLARLGFHEPPRLRERCRDCVWEGKTRMQCCDACDAGNGTVAVSKSFQSPYDKRVILPDGTGRTRANVVHDPLGGRREDDFGWADEPVAAE